VLERIFSGGSAEKRVLGSICKHIEAIQCACTTFKRAFEQRDKELMETIADIEREGDSIRREVVSQIYEGAFLPFLRPSICRFVEIADEVLDLLEDAAFEFEFADALLDDGIRENCLKVADLNIQMSEILLIAFETLLSKVDLREKTLVMRIFEKKVDEIKFDLIRKIRTKEIQGFWEGKALSDFIDYLTSVSDVFEDASDYLHMINLRMR
jgi:predicted phosphate transport protein (TIGR00153 family)